MYPDVEIVRTSQRSDQPPVLHRDTPGGEALPSSMTPVTVSVLCWNLRVRLATVEIRDVAQNQLVTSIEILSLVYKREPGFPGIGKSVSTCARHRDIYWKSICSVVVSVCNCIHISRQATIGCRSSGPGPRVTDIWSINLLSPCRLFLCRYGLPMLMSCSTWLRLS